MLRNKMDFSSCAIWTGFHKSSHIYWCIPVYTGVYLCILVYICVYLCIPVYTCVYLCILVYTCVYWCIPVYTGVYLCILVYTCVCIPVYTCAYLCILVYICVYSTAQFKLDRTRMQQGHDTTHFSFHMRASLRVHARLMTSSLPCKALVYALDVCTMYTGVYLCILVYTCVCWCIPVHIGIYLCILVYTCVY